MVVWYKTPKQPWCQNVFYIEPILQNSKGASFIKADKKNCALRYNRKIGTCTSSTVKHR